MEDLVEALRREVFSVKQSKFQELLIQCLDYLNAKKRLVRKENMEAFNEAMKNLSFAMQDNDYLLVTDILKFEILPCIKEEK